MLVETRQMADELVREVRRIRHAISRRYDHDVHGVVAYYRQFQDELKASGKHRFFKVPEGDAAEKESRSSIRDRVGT
jgi:hypothetical protein